MIDSSEPVTVMFADISGSTRLYDSYGDRRALAWVGECLLRLRQITAQAGGRTVRSIGDGLLCTFLQADAAVMVHVIMRAMEVQAAQTVSARAWSWNICIRPDVADFASLEFGATDALIARGREAAVASLPEIRAGLRSLLDEL